METGDALTRPREERLMFPSRSLQRGGPETTSCPAALAVWGPDTDGAPVAASRPCPADADGCRSALQSSCGVDRRRARFGRRNEPPVTVTVHVMLNEFVEAIVRDDGMGMSSRGDSPGLGLGLGSSAAWLMRSSSGRRPTASGSS
jgi:hypothetical protein